ncbi:NlpC/P60 family protein [Amycolatopsis nigrescens]|uniref:C40 family peptidase n=1 Tax=Amycolatopsis nigrescens TaxID=381445 RepID=UPI0003610C4C|nr:C40 family peptidase [Amycolatopsis nigrescens]
MTEQDAGKEAVPDEEQNGERQPSGRRKLIVTVAAVAVAAGTLVAVTQLAPPEDAAPVANTAPAGPLPELPSSMPPPSSQQPPPSQPPAQAPARQGQEFDAWVGKVAEWLDVPARVMTGYAKATVAMAKERPNCHLSWVTLAAVGRVATNHGRTGGGPIGDDGTAGAPIGTVGVRDFYDKVVSAPKATGPMQLTPALWQKYRGEAADVQNIDDSALAAGRALCDGDRDLAVGKAWWDGVAVLQSAPVILHRALATANVYGTIGKASVPPKPAVLQAVNFAIEKIGLPYVWGGNGEEKGDLGFDCSGLTTAAYGTAGITLKRTAHWQYGSVPLIPQGSEPELGDLIFYGEPSTKIHHVGLYIGNQQMIDAPTFGQAVQVHTYRKAGDDYAGAGRPA